VLTLNAAPWTKALEDSIRLEGKASKSVKSKYNNAQIKSALVSETHGKCAYCETKILHTQYGDIEHFVPKSLQPSKAFEWDNLTLACKVCNTLKSDRDPSANDIIDPYNQDPECHLDFCGAVLFAKNSKRGHETKAKLSLNRAELCERRKEALERLLSLVENAVFDHLTLSARKAIYDDFVRTELADDAQFAAMARALHRQVGPSIRAQWAGSCEQSR
jgi:uncharacterized protein (TIGR02646 family)